MCSNRGLYQMDPAELMLILVDFDLLEVLVIFFHKQFPKLLQIVLQFCCAFLLKIWTLIAHVNETSILILKFYLIERKGNLLVFWKRLQKKALLKPRWAMNWPTKIIWLFLGFQDNIVSSIICCSCFQPLSIEKVIYMKLFQDLIQRTNCFYLNA